MCFEISYMCINIHLKEDNFSSINNTLKLKYLYVEILI